MRKTLSTFIVLSLALSPTYSQTFEGAFSRSIDRNVQRLTEKIIENQWELAALSFDDMNWEGGNQDDPAYKAYREAYNLILEEEWKKARKKFEALISQFPKSEYLDDAAYWRAYAMKHLDEKKAIEEYKKFTNEYPKSNYYDDAVADLNELENDVVITTSEEPGVVISKKIKEGYSYAIAPTMRRAAVSMRRAERELRRMIRTWRTSSAPIPLIPPVVGIENEEQLDKETELRLEALYAIGETKEDQTSFQTLKEVALDRKQHLRLREAALDVLSDFKKTNIVPIFLDIAKNDTSPYLHNLAIDYLTDHIKDKNHSVDTLIELYRVIPKHRQEQREVIFYSIAEVGNDKAVDFLASVAKSDANYEMRKVAIYYLGSIGSEKARTVLYDILKKK